MALIQFSDHSTYRRLTVLSAHIDAESAARFEAEALSLIDERQLVVDLSRVRYVDSTGLGCILRIVRASADKGGRVVLCRPSPVVRMLLDFSQLRQFADISDSCDIPEGKTDGKK
ncbi:MAG: STAS domain-containing protein [Spirochaetota bacterium]